MLIVHATLNDKLFRTVIKHRKDPQINSWKLPMMYSEKMLFLFLGIPIYVYLYLDVLQFFDLPSSPDFKVLQIFDKFQSL